jgi:hypothetical protein
MPQMNDVLTGKEIKIPAEMAFQIFTNNYINDINMDYFEIGLPDEETRQMIKVLYKIVEYKIQGIVNRAVYAKGNQKQI